MLGFLFGLVGLGFCALGVVELFASYEPVGVAVGGIVVGVAGIGVGVLMWRFGTSLVRASARPAPPAA